MQTGLAWASTDKECLLEDALALAQRLAALPAGSGREVRAAFEASGRNDLPAQLEYERLRQRELLDREAFAEGVRAFLQKRQPEFHPRNGEGRG